MYLLFSSCLSNPLLFPSIRGLLKYSPSVCITLSMSVSEGNHSFNSIKQSGGGKVWPSSLFSVCLRQLKLSNFTNGWGWWGNISWLMSVDLTCCSYSWTLNRVFFVLILSALNNRHIRGRLVNLGSFSVITLARFHRQLVLRLSSKSQRSYSLSVLLWFGLLHVRALWVLQTAALLSNAGNSETEPK